MDITWHSCNEPKYSPALVQARWSAAQSPLPRVPARGKEQPESAFPPSGFIYESKYTGKRLSKAITPLSLTLFSYHSRSYTFTTTLMQPLQLGETCAQNPEGPERASVQGRAIELS
jgi:hypothetical protein